MIILTARVEGGRRRRKLTSGGVEKNRNHEKNITEQDDNVKTRKKW